MSGDGQCMLTYQNNLKSSARPNLFLCVRKMRKATISFVMSV